MDVQVIRRLHSGTVALVGIACSKVCEEIGELAGLFEASFIIAEGCLSNFDSSTRPTSSQVMPGPRYLADAFWKVVQKFGQVTVFSLFELQ